MMSHRVSAGLVFGLALGVVAAMLSLTPPAAMLEREVGLATLFQARGPRPAPDDVLVIGADSRSSLLLAGTPVRRELPRTVYARLVEELVRRGASAIAFDVFFRDARPGQDEALADAISAAERVVLFQRWGHTTPATTKLGDITSEGAVSPTERIARSAAAQAPFLIPAGSDRVHVWWPFADLGYPLPTLPLATFAVHAWRTMGAQARAEAEGLLDGHEVDATRAAPTDDLARLRQRISYDGGAAQAVDRLRASCTPERACDGDRRTLARLFDAFLGPGERVVNHYGPAGTLRRVPLARAVTGEGLPDDLTGTAVFVGAIEFPDREIPEVVDELLKRLGTAVLPPPPENPDIHATVFGFVSGVELAATIYANLVHGQEIGRLDRASSALLALGVGIVLGLAALALPALAGVAALLGVAAALAAGAWWAFSGHDLWLPVAVPLIVEVPVALAFGLIVQYTGASRVGQNLSRAMSVFVPESVVQRATKGESEPAGIEEINGVLLRTDIERYTEIASKGPPGILAVLLNQYFGALGEVVKRNHGEALDYVADEMMALWQPPGDGQSPLTAAERAAACRAALALHRQTTRFVLKTRDGEWPLKTRIGLDAGRFAIGGVGGRTHTDFGVYGDVPVTASRIEGLNKLLGTAILTSDRVIEGLEGLCARPMGTYLLLNKSEPVCVWELLDPEPEGRPDLDDFELPALCAEFGAAIRAYEAGDWAGAQRRFDELHARFPDDGPTRYWYARTRPNPWSQAGAPDGDDPVVKLDTK